MKNLILILSILLSSNLIAQNSNYKNTEVKYYVKHKPNWLNNSPGSELQKASIHFYTGLIIATLGSYTTLTKVEDKPIALNYIGIGTTILGSFLMIESNIHIYRAGIILDSRGIGISIPIK